MADETVAAATRIAPEFGELLRLVFDNDTRLTTADVHALSLGNAGAELLARALEANKTLATLVIRGTFLPRAPGASEANFASRQIR